jgi:hypothetical protein
MSRCGDIGITHPQIDDVFSPAARSLLEFINEGEHVGGESSNTMEILDLLGGHAPPPRVYYPELIGNSRLNGCSIRIATPKGMSGGFEAISLIGGITNVKGNFIPCPRSHQEIPSLGTVGLPMNAVRSGKQGNFDGPEPGSAKLSNSSIWWQRVKSHRYGGRQRGRVNGKAYEALLAKRFHGDC